MSAVDVQMQIWRANLDLWRRVFDMQLAMTRGMIEASTAWTWQGVGMAGDAARAEQDAAREAVGMTIEVMREADTAAPSPSGAKAAGKAPARSDAAPAEAAHKGEETASVAAQSVEDVVEAAADKAQETASKTAKPKADEAKLAATGGARGKSAAARRSTSKTTSAARGRRKRS